jgi:hypothetical protein
MLKRPNPTLQPKRFKSNDMKSLVETIQNVSNRSLLNEFGTVSGSGTADPLMQPRKKRSLGGLEIPGSDEDVEGTEGTETSSSGFGSGTATETPKLTGPQSTALGGKSTRFKTKTGSASGFRLDSTSSDMGVVKSSLGKESGKFSMPGMDTEAGAFYQTILPAAVSAISGAGAAGARALGPLADIIGIAATGKVAPKIADAGKVDSDKFLTKKPKVSAPIPTLR